MKKVFKYVLLILFFSLAIILFNQSLVKAAEPASTVSINGVTLNNEYKYLVNGEKAESGTLGSGGCTAQFDSNTGVLTLNGYSGRKISVSEGDLTIKLIGNNLISDSSTDQVYGISSYRDNSITITSDSEASLTINVSSHDSLAVGIYLNGMNQNGNGSIIIGGKANVNVRGSSDRGSARGIYASARVSIIENASFAAKLSGYYNQNLLQCGIQITKPLLINTTGNIDLDASYDPVFNWPCNGYGIYSTSTLTLNNVGTMTIKYPTKNGGDAWNASWTIPEKFAVNEGVVNGVKTKEIHSGSGMVHTLTLESAVNIFGKTKGQYFNGDVIKISGTTDVIGLKFKNWVCSAGLVENNRVENTKYTMPNSDATVIANYTAFASQPKFTKTDDMNGKIDYTLNGEFIESERRLVKSAENAEDEFSRNHDFLGKPYEIKDGTESDQVPAGEYKIAVKKENKWYYSDIFTVNYDEQIPEENIININEVSDNNTIDDTSVITNVIDTNKNEIKNEIKLPKTGEKTNILVEWLKSAVPLITFWLVSMIWIDYEKKRMTKK